MENTDTKFCIKCGKKIPANSEFCPFCGAKQELTSKDSSSQKENDNAKHSESKSNDAIEPNSPFNENTNPGLIESTKLFFKDLIVANKRMGRADYWWSTLGIFLLSFIFFLVLSVLVTIIKSSFVISILGAILYAYYAIIGIGGISAGIRRLHDTNHSGWFYLLNLIPLIGSIILIVMYCGTSENKNNNWPIETQNSEKSVWYKNWWVWLIILASALLGFSVAKQAFEPSVSTKYSTQSHKNNNEKNVTATNNDDSTDSPYSADDESSSNSDDELNLPDDTFNIKRAVEYKPDYSDSSWAGTNVDIDKVKIATVKPQDYFDGENTYKPQGVILVHFKVTAGRDINFYPSQATLITSDGQQIDADSNNSDDFDGEINKGVTREGYIAFIVKKMSRPDSLDTLRLKWDSDYDTDDYDDDNSMKTYDININLN